MKGLTSVSGLNGLYSAPFLRDRTIRHGNLCGLWVVLFVILFMILLVTHENVREVGRSGAFRSSRS
jgi:hypothetical protein